MRVPLNVLNPDSHTYVPDQWKPFCLRWPFLTFLNFCVLVPILGIEGIVRTRGPSHEVSFLNDPSITSSIFFSNYFLTILSILFGIGLAKVDLDVKRLEPFFQLSKQGGTPAPESLSLTYPNEWLPFASITSARHRHWAVFVSSVATMLSFWGISPFVGAIFTVDIVNVSIPIPIVFGPRIEDLRPNSSYVPGKGGTGPTYPIEENVFYNTYLIQSLGAPQPPLTTDNFTTSHFFADNSILGEYLTSASNQNWVVVTDAYTIEPSCETPSVIAQPANRSDHDDGSLKISSRNQGCEFELFDPSYASRQRDPTGELLAAVSTFDFPAGDHCPDQLSYILVEFGQTTAYRENHTWSLCKFSWLTYRVSLTLNSNQSIVDSKRLSDPKPIRREITSFMADFTRRTGNIPLRGQDRRLDVVWSEGSNKLMQYMTPISSNLTEWFDPDHLAKISTSAFRLLGIQYIKTLLVIPGGIKDGAGNGQISEATWNGEMQRVVIVYAFARLVQAFCILEIFLLGALTFVLLRRSSGLRSDPGSIASLMSLITHSGYLQSAFQGSDKIYDVDSHIKTGVYQIGELGLGRRHQLDLIKGGDNPPQPQSVQGPRRIHPLVLLQVTGLFVTILFSCLLAFIIFLYFLSLRLQGLPIISTGSAAQQVIYNYIPTFIGMLIEPFWTLIARNLAIVEPLRQLNQRRAVAAKSICLQLTTLTSPALFLWILIKRQKHIWVCWIAGMAVLANLLAISLTGLFRIDLRSRGQTIAFTPPYKLEIESLPVTVDENRRGFGFPSLGLGSRLAESQDYFADLTLYDQDNLSPKGVVATDGALSLYEDALKARSVPYPSWTTEDTFILPFIDASDATEISDSSLDTIFCAPSPGFRLELECQPYIPKITKSNYSCVTREFVDVTSCAQSSGGDGDVEYEYLHYQIDNHEFGFSCDNILSPTMKYHGDGIGVELYDVETSPTDPKPDYIGNSTYRHFNGWCRKQIFFTIAVQVLKEQSRSTVGIHCNPRLLQETYQTCVDREGNIKSARLVEGSTKISVFSEGLTVDDLLGTLPRFLRGKLEEELSLSYSIGNLTPSLLPPDDMILATKKVYNRYFPLYLGVFQNTLFRSSRDTANSNTAPQQITGYVEKLEQRYVVNREMLIITVIILGLYIITLIVFYGSAVKSLIPTDLPRFPLSLASILAYIYKSEKVFRVVENLQNYSAAERHRRIIEKNKTFGFGRFRDRLGDNRFGIEEEPLL